MLCCKGIAVNVGYLDKASDIIHSIFAAKLVRHELGSFEKLNCLFRDFCIVWNKTGR